MGDCDAKIDHYPTQEKKGPADEGVEDNATLRSGDTEPLYYSIRENKNVTDEGAEQNIDFSYKHAKRSCDAKLEYSVIFMQRVPPVEKTTRSHNGHIN